MYSAEIPFGGVSPTFTRRLKGQSTIEYVLIIAIIALLILIVGPWVSSAIRNQFDTVAGAIGSGTAGEGFREPQDIPDAQNGTAFAVYSADDHSLMFYKRRGVPKVGDMFNCRRVTEVYTGFETETYTGTWPDDDCPWFPIARQVKSVTVADDGIKPLSMAWWFNQFVHCESFDLGNIDTSKCTSLERLFSSCGSVAAADLRGLGTWDTGNVQSMFACFDGMFKLTEIPGILNWDTASCVSFSAAFFNCTGLQHLDISHWSNKSCKTRTAVLGICTFRSYRRRLPRSRVCQNRLELGSCGRPAAKHVCPDEGQRRRRQLVCPVGRQRLQLEFCPGQQG